jgi:hypothetical protein
LKLEPYRPNLSVVSATVGSPGHQFGDRHLLVRDRLELVIAYRWETELARTDAEGLLVIARSWSFPPALYDAFLIRHPVDVQDDFVPNVPLEATGRDDVSRPGIPAGRGAKTPPIGWPLW